MIRGPDFGSQRGESARDVCFGFGYPELERGMLVYPVHLTIAPSMAVGWFMGYCATDDVVHSPHVSSAGLACGSSESAVLVKLWLARHFCSFCL